jgi:proteasome accessory factor C
MVMVGGHGYVEAWCRRAGALRRFRVDRIDALRERDEPAAPPPHARPAPIQGGGIFQPGAELPLVTLRIGRHARWITEYYPCEQVVEESADGWLVSLRVTDLAWARRLVLGLGPDAAVVAPPALAASVRAHAAAALDAYATPTGLVSPD